MEYFLKLNANKTTVKNNEENNRKRDISLPPMDLTNLGKVKCLPLYPSINEYENNKSSAVLGRFWFF